MISDYISYIVNFVSEDEVLSMILGQISRALNNRNSLNVLLLDFGVGLHPASEKSERQIGNIGN